MPDSLTIEKNHVALGDAAKAFDKADVSVDAINRPGPG